VRAATRSGTRSALADDVAEATGERRTRNVGFGGQRGERPGFGGVVLQEPYRLADDGVLLGSKPARGVSCAAREVGAYPRRRGLGRQPLRDGLPGYLSRAASPRRLVARSGVPPELARADTERLLDLLLVAAVRAHSRAAQLTPRAGFEPSRTPSSARRYGSCKTTPPNPGRSPRSPAKPTFSCDARPSLQRRRRPAADRVPDRSGGSHSPPDLLLDPAKRSPPVAQKVGYRSATPSAPPSNASAASDPASTATPNGYAPRLPDGAQRTHPAAPSPPSSRTPVPRREPRHAERKRARGRARSSG